MAPDGAMRVNGEQVSDEPKEMRKTNRDTPKITLRHAEAKDFFVDYLSITLAEFCRFACFCGLSQYNRCDTVELRRYFACFYG